MEKIDKYYILFMTITMICLTAFSIAVILGMFKENNTNNYDANRDGVVDARDYVAIKNYIMEK